jgi:phage terminase small subunit
MSKLNDKQKRFCLEYMKDFNGAQAALRSGYSQKNSHVSAASLLSNPNIQAYLAELKAELKQKTEISLEMVVEGYRKLAFFDSRKFYKDGRPVNIEDLDDDSAFALNGFEASVITTDYGAKVVTNKIKMSDRKQALDSICRVLGYNAPDKVASVTPDGQQQAHLLSEEQFRLLIETINK